MKVVILGPPYICKHIHTYKREKVQTNKSEKPQKT